MGDLDFDLTLYISRKNIKEGKRGGWEGVEKQRGSLDWVVMAVSALG